MARRINILTDRKIAKLGNRRGRFHDGRGLFLQITATGGKSWVFRYERGGKRHMLGLGSLHDVTLQAARDLRDEKRKALKAGVDLSADIKKRPPPPSATAPDTFEKIANAYYDFHSPKWTNRKAAAQFLSTMRTYVIPIFKSTPVADIDKKLIREVLEQHVEAEHGYPAGKFWMARPVTASRVRGRIENVLNYATVNDMRTGPNPAAWSGNLEHLLPPTTKIKRSQSLPALPFIEIPAFVHALRVRPGIASRALESCILTGGRTNELTQAKWDEIDLQHSRWEIPAERMKAGEQHRVPLCGRALAILQDLPRESDWLFPGIKQAARSLTARWRR